MVESSNSLSSTNVQYVPDLSDLLYKAGRSSGTVFYRTDAIDRLAINLSDPLSLDFSRASILSTDSLASYRSDEHALAGYLSYEAGFGFEDRWNTLSKPEKGWMYRFFKVPCWYEVNHSAKTARIVYTSGCSKEQLDGMKAFIQSHTVSSKSFETKEVNPLASDELAALGELSAAEYSSRIESILADIHAGRYYEINFTQRFRCTSRCHPLVSFLYLLNSFGAPRAFYMNSGNEIISGCSPEVFLIKTGHRVETRPIKGSFVRNGVLPEISEKLYAEHTMVVDLARNDLGRISDEDWVSVPRIYRVSKLGELCHIESFITGHTSKSWIEVLPDIYPAASITGAPKVEVVQAINEYEVSPRGVYTGSCGWIMPTGDLDLNVAIRTLTAIRSGDEWNYEMGAGGAIVADSDPLQEYRECLLKALPIVSSVMSE